LFIKNAFLTFFFILEVNVFTSMACSKFNAESPRNGLVLRHYGYSLWLNHFVCVYTGLDLSVGSIRECYYGLQWSRLRSVVKFSRILSDLRF